MWEKGKRARRSSAPIPLGAPHQTKSETRCGRRGSDRDARLIQYLWGPPTKPNPKLGVGEGKASATRVCSNTFLGPPPKFGGPPKRENAETKTRCCESERLAWRKRTFPGKSGRGRGRLFLFLLENILVVRKAISGENYRNKKLVTYH